MKLISHFVTVGSNTLLSRVLGFVREILIAATLGAGPVADAFYAAFRFPNLFRRLFAEGAFNAAFIPLFSGALEADGKIGARRFAEDVAAALVAILLVLTAVVELAAPAFVATVIAPGFAEDPEKFDLTVMLSRVMFPYLACMSLVAMLSGMLNALHRYFAAAFAPVLLNIILIGVLFTGYVKALDPMVLGHIMAWGVFVSGFAQLVLLGFAVRRSGFALTPRIPRLTKGVRRLLVLAAPAALAGGITQINLFVGQMIASQEAGAISVLQFSDRIYQLPLGMVGIAVGVVLLPELSRALKAGEAEAGAQMQNRSLEFSLLLTVPAAAAIAVMPGEIIQVLFERGEFTSATTQRTAAALALFAPGLPAFVLVKVFSPGFFAREDTKTPMRIAGITMGVNVVLSLALFGVMAEAGIALATSIAGWINAGLLGWMLARRGHWAHDGALNRRIAMILLSAAIMAGALWLGILGLGGRAEFAAAGLATRIAYLTALVGGGGLVYFAACQLTGAVDLRTLRDLLRARKPAP